MQKELHQDLQPGLGIGGEGFSNEHVSAMQ